MNRKKTTRNDGAGHLRTPEEMAVHLEACFKEADVDGAVIAKALGDIARSRGMTHVARDAGLSRESLYKALSGERTPAFDTILKVMSALGLKLRAEATEAGSGRPQSGETLKESGAFLRALIRTIPDLVWLKDPDGKYLFCNSRFEDLYGAEEKEIIGKTDFDFTDKELAGVYRENDALAIAEGKPVIIEEEAVYSVDGHREILESVKTPVYGSDGRLVGVLGIGRDISGRKRLERENLSNLYFFENMDKVHRIMQAGVDLEQTLLDVLDAVYSIFGCDRAFLLYPCDPESPTYTTMMERANPEFPGAPHPGAAMPMSPLVKTFMQALLCTDYTVEIVSGKEIDPEAEPWKTSKIKSSMARAVYPKVGKPWVFGMHQCSDARVWTPAEKVLFRGISLRLADSLTSLLMYRDLKQNQDFLDNIIENIPNLLFVRDAEEQRLVRWNKAGEELTGFTREEILGKSYYDFLPKEEADYFTSKDNEVLDTRQLVDIPEETINTKAGEKRILHTKKIPIPDETGKPKYLLGIAEDITKRKQAEDKLRESEDFYRNLVEMSPFGISLTDLKGTLLMCNRPFAEIFGYESPEQILGVNASIFGSPEERVRGAEFNQTVIEKGQAGDFKYFALKKDGTRIIAETRASLIRDSRGKPVVMGVTRDITAREQAEHERIANLHFLESLDQFNRAIQGTNDLDRMMSDALDAVLSVFGCDRAFLAVPCDPESPEFHIRMERTTPAYPGAFEKGVPVPMSQAVKDLFHVLLKTPEPDEIYCGNGLDPEDEPWKTYEVKSQLAIALYPKVGKPWEFGLHQCSHARVWTPQEKKLFQEISRRLADGLTTLLINRDLKRNQEFLDNVIENLPDLMYVKDADEYRYVRWNRASEEHLGFSQEEILGKTEYDFLPKEEAEHFLAMDREVLGMNRLVDIPENKVRTRAGEERIFHTRKIPIPDETGKPKYLLGISEDITERRKNEIELIETKERLQSFMDSATDAISIYDSGYRLIDLNKAALSYLPEKTEKKDLIGKNISDLVLDFDADHVPETYKRVLYTGIPYHETHFFTVSGKRHWIIVKIFKVGNGLGILSTDITALKVAEEETNNIKEHLQSFMNSATDIMFVLDSKLNFTNINEAWIAYFPDGIKKEDLIGKNIRNFTELFDDKQLFVKLDRVLETGNPHIFETLITFSPNDPRWFNARVFKVGDGLGIIANDVTDKKNLEEQLRHAQKMESVGRLAGGVAHDFNNMLGIIIGHAELAQSGMKPDDPLFENLQEIRNAADRSADLTRQLLAFARKQIVAPKVIDLNETMEGMLKMLRALIGEQIDLAWQPGKDLWPIRMDPSQIDQIIANLCVNARDAITDDGAIVIETKNATFDEKYCAFHQEVRPGDFVMLSVSDNGTGMDKETMDKIFEPFFTTKEIGKGTGLGLATVYGIVNQNEGFITVYSEPGVGTIFKIFLPRQMSGTERTGQATPAIRGAQGQETILLVEDVPDILTMTALMLERFGYRVMAASTPEEAIRIAGEQSGKIHLLISDVIMPGMNGRALAQSISSISPGIKHLFMSGYTDDVIAHHGVLDQGVHFIQKPFSMQSLAAKAREALDSD